MNPLNISIIQANLVWENIEQNLNNFEVKINQLQGKPDIIVLPEMFSTGFSMTPEKFAEAPLGKTHYWMQLEAQKSNAVITGSYIVEEKGQFFNRLVWMQPDGAYFFYDKRHLFTLSDEPKYYTAGNKKLIVEWKGWKICPLICYDLRFPVWSRNVENYDLLIYVANWPERRSHHWKSLLMARAIENQCYTIGVNRVGNDGNEVYHSGDSTLVDYTGRILAQTAHVETSISISIDFEEQQQFRSKFRFLADKDNFSIENKEGN